MVSPVLSWIILAQYDWVLSKRNNERNKYEVLFALFSLIGVFFTNIAEEQEQNFEKDIVNIISKRIQLHGTYIQLTDESANLSRMINEMEFGPFYLSYFLPLLHYLFYQLSHPIISVYFTEIISIYLGMKKKHSLSNAVQFQKSLTKEEKKN